MLRRITLTLIRPTTSCVGARHASPLQMRRDADWGAAPPPLARHALEHARARRPAVAAASVHREIPACEVVPVALHERRITGMAAGGLPCRVVDVAGVDVTQAALPADAARQLQRRGRSGRCLL